MEGHIPYTDITYDLSQKTKTKTSGYVKTTVLNINRLRKYISIKVPILKELNYIAIISY